MGTTFQNPPPQEELERARRREVGVPYCEHVAFGAFGAISGAFGAIHFFGSALSDWRSDLLSAVATRIAPRIRQPRSGAACAFERVMFGMGTVDGRYLHSCWQNSERVAKAFQRRRW